MPRRAHSVRLKLQLLLAHSRDLSLQRTREGEKKAIVPGPSLQACALEICNPKKLSQPHRGSPNYLPQKCREDAALFLKGPRWTEQRLQYDLFREALRHPMVTSRGIPELLNHCGSFGGGATRGVGGATGDMAQTAYYPTKECVKTGGHNSQCISTVAICSGLKWAW